MYGVKGAAYKVAVGVMMFVLFLMAGCGVSHQTRLYAQDDGSQIEIDLDKTIEVALEANPSTGYSWEMLNPGNGVLEQDGEAEFQQEVKDKQLVGVGGVEILRFKAKKTGQTTLELVYHRPWEKDVKPAKTFSVQVTVR